MLNLIKKNILALKHIILSLLKPFYFLKKSIEFRRRMLYAYCYKFISIKENTILFESYHGSNMSGNPYSIFREVLNNREFTDYRYIWVVNDINNDHVKQYSKMKNVKFVKRNSINYIIQLCRSKFLINNTTFPYYFIKKEQQIYINTWHGTPFKTLGKDIKNSINQHKNVQRNFLHADYIVSPNRFTTNVLLQAYDLEGIYNGRIVEEGYPRNDLIINSYKEEIKNKLRSIIDLDPNKKIVLYAPTWRGENEKVRNTNSEILNIINEIHNNIPDDFTLLLKVHGFTYKYIKNNKKLLEKCIPDWFETNELLSIVDVLITDYSSIWVDYLNTNNPIIFYLYDKDSYINKRGLYLSLDELPGPVCNNIFEVTNALYNIQDVIVNYEYKYKQIKKKFCYMDNGGSTKRIIDIVFNGKQTANLGKLENTKVKILIHCGNFATNGITSSAVNLLNNIDYSKYDVTVILFDDINEIQAKNLKKLNPNVKFIYRISTFNLGILDFYRYKAVLKFGLKNQWVKMILPKSLYKNELVRIVGKSKFDLCIDFSGYSSFWTLIFAFNDFKKKCIYLHSDMVADYNRNVNGKYVLRRNFDVIFHLYQYFDKLIAVSKNTKDINLAKLKPYNVENKVIYSNNVLDYDKIFSSLQKKEVINREGQDYLVVNEQNDLGVITFRGVPIPLKGNINFVIVGRLSPEKDHEKLINAFIRVSKIHKNVTLYIIGDGPLRKYLTGVITKAKVKNIFLTGQLENPFPLISCCDCFILSSNHEGQPMVLLEALVLDMPIVATDIPGNRGVLEKGYGELVGNSEDGLYQGMIKYINGEIKPKSFDFEKYNRAAMEMFYNRVCSIEGEEERASR